MKAKNIKDQIKDEIWGKCYPKTSTLRETWRMAMQEYADHVLSERMPKNPYPEEMFPTLSEDDSVKIALLIGDNGYSPDRVFGNWGRSVWNNCIEAVKQQLKQKKA